MWLVILGLEDDRFRVAVVGHGGGVDETDVVNAAPLCVAWCGRCDVWRGVVGVMGGVVWLV